ncbi:hypothetical protein COR50_14045 [Chitinophaga caeni]|uniref:Uncharacterized protein n=1 Tax=Chitinophaga caeni TaxID=2029983 RepID=A0A291QWD2_9BACT|nr:hypothetical protein [Chitinophaga caeni]ATL48192.1 hypothetical protein COR50_14045 [Chitinophaga caeni]
MAIDKELKKKVIEDWQNAFPQLTLYAQDKLYKVVGPVIIGLELIKLPRTEEYRPHFVVYSLFGNKMGNDVKACLAGPILLQEYSNKKGFQYDIPYTKHSTFISDVIESVKKQTPLPFDSNISLKKIVSVIDEHSKTPPLSAAPNSYLQAALQEAKLKTALFIGVTEAQSVLEQINKRNWDTNHFKACGVDVNEWLQSLQTTISNRDEFLKQIEANKQDKKISQLKSSELTA